MSTHDDSTTPDLEGALATVRSDGKGGAVLAALAASDILLPQADAPTGGAAEEGQITLPVLEQDGTHYVPAFTSADKLRTALPQAEGYATVRGADLGSAWPADDLWLALNPGDADGASVPPDAVRALPALLDGD